MDGWKWLWQKDNVKVRGKGNELHLTEIKS